MNRFFLSFLFTTFLLASYGQIPDSVKQKVLSPESISPSPDTLPIPGQAELVDSTELKKKGWLKNFLKKDYPSPKKAALLSVIPGGGQLYNKKYWKVPLVFGAYGGMVFLVINNKEFKQSFDAAYATRLEVELPNPCDAVCQEIVDSRLSTESIRIRRASAGKNLQLSYIGIVAVVVLSAADAFVDAHLKSFDISEDLSINIQPRIQLSPGGTENFGLGLAMKF